MKFFSKIFLVVTLILCISLSLFGYFLISRSFQNGIEQEKNQVLEEYKMMHFSLQSGLVSIKEQQLIRVNSSSSLIPDSLLSQSDDTLIGVFSQQNEVLYSEYPENYDFSILESADPKQLVFEILPVNDSYFLTIAGYVTLPDAQILSGTSQTDSQQISTAASAENVYLLYGKDIHLLLEQRQQLEDSFKFIYCAVCSFGILALLACSFLFMRPFRQLTQFAEAIAQGEYDRRVQIHTHDELGELADTCNSMADAIQQSIETLTQTAIQKEDFTANFAHELKTPLTSVIGYADMIYQKDLSKEEIRNAAWYILDEGLRLEELSGKLMDLIVLERHEFLLEELSAREFLQNTAQTLRPVCENSRVTLQLDVCDAYIRIEYDLFKTLLLNLIDNAIKADADTITISGKSIAKTYQISISDNGCGIPESEINRITEAFYMIDKSRSRSQHGAGLGLSLVSRIAELHHARLSFESTPGIGTTVSVTLPL